MKILKVISSGLASGVLRMRPEVLGVMKKLEADGAASTDRPTDIRRGRMVFVSPLPGRWIRWSCLVLAGAGLCLVQAARAAGQPSAFDCANQAFAEGKTAEAAHAFESIIARQGYSAPVLFNLANAQFRAGRTGEAVLSYERAQWLAPGDPDVATNLRLALDSVPLALRPSAPLLPFADWLRLNEWASAGVAALLLLSAMLPLALLFPARRPALRVARVVASLALLCSLSAIGARWGEVNRAAVIAKQAVARIAPVNLGPPAFNLPEGASVSIVKPHAGFTLVRTRDGRQGWVSRDTVEPVIPGPF